ncbi:MAG: hypothetical protein KDI66_19455, partial [Xanthomonadales bacterium]|nr:hypothetical protein [Xanthomonadales bacterium]
VLAFGCPGFRVSWLSGVLAFGCPGFRFVLAFVPPGFLSWFSWVSWVSRLGYHPDTWTRQVLAVKSDYSRAIGAVESLVEKAAEIGQRWLRGIATARRLAAA